MLTRRVMQRGAAFMLADVIFRGSRSAYERRLTVSLSIILAKILGVVNYRRFYAAARV